MSKELIELQEAFERKYASEDGCYDAYKDMLLEYFKAGAALEAKAAPVGELIKVVDDIVMERDIMGDICIKTGGITVAKVIYKYPHTDNASTRRLANLIVDAMSAGAARQRAQQPQSAEAEPVGIVHEQYGFCWYEGKKPAPGTKLYTAPQPSAVVMPDVDDLANFIRYTDGSHKMGAGALAERIVDWLSAQDARLNGKEVGRG